MGRLQSLAAVLAGALAAGPAAGAEITRVSSSGEPDSAFDLRLDVRWDRVQRQARITREYGDTRRTPTGTVADNEELSFSEVTNRLVPTLHVGLWHDLELRAELPYVVNDDVTWKDASDGTSSITATTYPGIDANGALCPSGAPCPFFPVGKTSYAGGALDDLKIGVAYGILNERKEAFAPTWVVSLDLTVPTAARWDPAADRLAPATFFDAPSFAASKRAKVGRKIWVYELATALSKRMGAADPYFQVHLRIPQRSNTTYSNCDHAAELAGLPSPQMLTAAPALCKTAGKDLADADPPLVSGVIFGVELVPYEDRATAQKLALDVRLSGDYTGRGRWYNELTPATGKLMHNEPYLGAAAQLALRFRASRYITLVAQGRFQYDANHLVSGEAMGHVSNEVVSPPTNPNFDYRWDLPGRRFLVMESIAYSVGVGVTVSF